MTAQVSRNPANSATSSAPASVSVVVCTYSEDRWDDLVAAVTSLRDQELAAGEVVIVVDHNPALADRVRVNFDDVVVVENTEARGLSGARNTGLTTARQPIIAFLDDDAVAASDWLKKLVPAFDDPSLMGVGGGIEPMWLGERPGWFPDEFLWVVGCTYAGMPRRRAVVRNLLGCNMAFRREVFESVGGFRCGIGRVGTRPVGCEETELCIRIKQRWPQSLLVEPDAVVRHRVPHARASWSYFRRRCYSEGLSKAQVALLVGASDGLATERSYVTRTLVRALARAMATARPWDLTPATRSGAIIGGLAHATAGYAAGRLSAWARRGGQRHGVSSGSEAELAFGAVTP